MINLSKRDVAVVSAGTGAGTVATSLVGHAAGWPFFWTVVAGLICAVIAVCLNAQISVTKKRTTSAGTTTTTERILSFRRSGPIDVSNPPPSAKPVTAGAPTAWLPPD